jgi:hypothetical protein
MIKANLINIAESVAQTKGFKVDRLARRSKDCLICWFCEIAPEIMIAPIQAIVQQQSHAAQSPEPDLLEPNPSTAMQEFDIFCAGLNEEQLREEDMMLMKDWF